MNAVRFVCSASLGLLVILGQVSCGNGESTKTPSPAAGTKGEKAAKTGPVKAPAATQEAAMAKTAKAAASSENKSAAAEAFAPAKAGSSVVPATARELPESPDYRYVSPDGLPWNDGSRANPWDLQTALNQPPSVKPGHTIWIRGGIYRGSFVSKLAGTAEAPVTLRQFPNERATLDGNPEENLNPGLNVLSSWAVYWGFEVMNSSPVRSLRGNTPAETKRGNCGVVTDAPNVKFVNMTVRDNLVGFGVWGGAADTEIYGCLIYNNGFDAPDRGHGHGIYTQNVKGERRLIDNIIFNQFSHGIHAYGSGAAGLLNLVVVGNVCFNNGTVSKWEGSGRNILVGGGSISQNPVINDNCTYFATGQHGSNMFGLGAGATNLEAHRNFFVGDAYPLELAAWTPTRRSSVQGSITGNTLLGIVDPSFKKEYGENTYSPEGGPLRPASGRTIFIRPNRFETGRANVTIYNWDRAEAVEVDLSKAGLKKGDPYEVRDAEDFFGKPVASGIYTGEGVRIPMTGESIAQPVGTGFVEAKHTPVEFGAFVVLPGREKFLQPTAQTLTPPGTGTGLRAEYFENSGGELEDPKLTSRKATRVDPTIDFLWKEGTPDTVTSDMFSARWTGEIEARYTGLHRFFPESDTGARLWVGGQLLFDRWSIYPIDAHEKPIMLKAGQKYSIRMEYFGRKGRPPRARLRWSAPGFVKEVVPATQLYPAP